MAFLRLTTASRRPAPLYTAAGLRSQPAQRHRVAGFSVPYVILHGPLWVCHHFPICKRHLPYQVMPLPEAMEETCA